MIRRRLLRRVPLLTGSAIGATVLVTSLFAILILAVWAQRIHLPFVWALALFAFISIDALMVDRLGGETWISPLTLGATVAFIGAVTVALLRYVLDRRPITTDKVFGAVAA